MAEAFRSLSPAQVARLQQLSQPQLNALEQLLKQKVRDGETVSPSELAGFDHRDTDPGFSAGYNNVMMPPASGGF